MATYLARRLLLMIPTLLGITCLVFMLVAMAPGGIGAALQAQAGGNMQASSGVAVQQAYLEDRYGLNDPVILQYFRWLGRISPIKFGQRDQLLPSGEVISPPRPIAPPPLWQWFTQALPEPAPAPTEPIARDTPAEKRLEVYRALERRYANDRYDLLAATTLLKGQLVRYARAAGIPEPGEANKPRIGVIERAGPLPAIPEFARVRELEDKAIEAYGRAVSARAAFAALYDSRPFPEAGVGIPGVISLAWPDFGTAFSRGRPVIEMIPPALAVTLSLNLCAIPIIYFVAIPSGMLAAIRRGSLLDVGLGSLYIALYSFPVVLAGVLAIGFLASRDYLNAFPVAGLHAKDADLFTFLPSHDAGGTFRRGWLLDLLWHMGLPVMCLVYTGFAILSKQTRASMLENFSADYVRTAKAKGVAPKDVVLRHVFRNSLLPLITIFVTIFPGMLAGSVVVERIFSIPGMGSLVLDAVYLRDGELILADTVMIAVVNLVALLLADILYALADPRVTYD
jgi:microcin C transport system permease protein